jgi:gluconate 2-dehydrogenase gamma chain
VDERHVLEAMLSRLIPADEHGPGALEAGVADYVAGRLPDTCALAALPDGFAELPPAEQDAVLAELEGTELFETVRLLAIQGMFGDPSYGGNAGGAGWRLLGYAGPRPVHTAEDQALA